VQFRWDRDGKKDANSSCWVRVATLMGGKQWGMIHIPRIGQEVIVAFEEGDPDQPIIVGMVFNSDQMPPYALPDNKTQSGFKTRSSPGGGAEDFNELRFEDKKGSEEIYVHAQKDYNLVVENNQSLKVGNPQAPDGSQTTEVYKDRTETVKTGNEKLTVETGNRDITVTAGDDSKKVTAGTSKTEAGTAIELKVGGNSIKIDQSGITISGIKITIEGTAQVKATSPLTEVSSSGVLTLKGSITNIN
jgi:type VI secretion system secreted protein VgrG